jgi:hypothetical protein
VTSGINADPSPNGTGEAPGGSAPLEAQVAVMAAWLTILVEPGSVTELRVLECGEGRWCDTYSGYFDAGHLLAMARDAMRLTGRSEGVYWMLNPLLMELLARRQNRIGVVKRNKDICAKDNHILKRRWLLVDVDPRRVRGISSTDVEKQWAQDAIERIRGDLTARGWPPGILGDSANGFHSLHRVDLPADDGGLVQRCLKALAKRFDNEHVAVDVSVHNAGRICKLYGTWARKGESTKERPHRRSKLLDIPGCPDRRNPTTPMIESVPHELLEALAAEAPAAPKRAARPSPRAAAANGPHNHKLLVSVWLKDRGQGFTEDTMDAGGVRYRLTACPFDPSHTNPDAAIFQGPDGQLGFKCFHNSCADNHWQQAKDKIGKPEPHHWDPPLPAGRRGAARGRTAAATAASVGQAVPTSPPEPGAPPSVSDGRPADAPADDDPPFLVDFCNYKEMVIELEGTNKDGEPKTRVEQVGLAAAVLARRIMAHAGDWPKRVGQQLFVADHHRVRYLESTDAVFAFIGSQFRGQANAVKWGRAEDMVTHGQLVAQLRVAAEEFESVESFPHEPSLERHYYLYPPLQGGDGSASTTSVWPVLSSVWTWRTASNALRPDRYVYCSGCRSASKIGSETSTTAICATRSLIVGIPSGLCLPSGLGM